MKKSIHLNDDLVVQVKKQGVFCLCVGTLVLICLKQINIKSSVLLLLFSEAELVEIKTAVDVAIIWVFVFLVGSCIAYVFAHIVLFLYYKTTKKVTVTMYWDFLRKARKMKQLKVPLRRIRANIHDEFPTCELERTGNTYILYLYKNHWFHREQVEKNTDFFKSVMKLPIYKIEEDYNKITLIFTAKELVLDYAMFLNLLDKNKVVIGYNDKQEAVFWDYNTLPHLLGVGTTSSGKSNFMNVVIDSLHLMGAKMMFADGKRVELVHYQFLGYEVFTDNFIALFERVHATMMSRYKKMEAESLQRKAVINHYTKLSFECQPLFLIIDEWASITDNLSREVKNKNNESDYKKLIRLAKDILQLGRASGVQIIAFMQDPKSTTLDTSLRNNFNMRVLLGSVKEKTAYDMLFGSEYRNLESQKTGAGYYAGHEPPQVFHIPLWSKSDCLRKEE